MSVTRKTVRKHTRLHSRKRTQSPAEKPEEKSTAKPEEESNAKSEEDPTTTSSRRRNSSSKKDPQVFNGPRPAHFEIRDRSSQSVTTTSGKLEVLKQKKQPSPCEINLAAGPYPRIFRYAPTETMPATLWVQNINPEILRGLSRTKRIQLIEALSRVSARVTVQVSEETKSGRDKSKYVTRNTEVDLATVAILSLALRAAREDSEARNLVSELVGLSPETTLRNMLAFCRPPFVCYQDIILITHNAARRTSQTRKSMPQQVPIASALKALTHLIAKILDSTPDMTEGGWEKHKEMFWQLLLNWDDDIDRAIHAALLLLGLRRLIANSQRKGIKFFDRAKLITDLVLNGLAIPVPGVAVAGPVIGWGLDMWKEKRADKYKELWMEVKNKFTDEFLVAIARGEELKVGEDWILIQKELFKFWYDNVLSWASPSDDLE